MRSINITVSIHELVDGEILTSVLRDKTLPSDPDCDTDVKPISFSNFISPDVTLLLTETINIPLLMVVNDGNIGYYDGINCSGDTVAVDYEVSGTTESNLDEVIGYSGNYTIGVNFARPPFFTGVVSVNGSLVTYVLNGNIDFNGYVAGTGIIYITDITTGATTFRYSRLSQLLTIDDDNSYYNKNHFTFGEVSPMVVQNNVFVDRGDAVSVHELIFNLTDHKTNEDFEDSNIYQIYNN